MVTKGGTYPLLHYCNLTTKVMSTFGVDDRIKAKLIELTVQMSHASHYAIVYATRSATQIATTSGIRNALIFKPKA